MNVLYQFNELYAPFAGTSIVSLLENNKENEITIYILGENLSENSISRFEKIGRDYDKNIVVKDTKEIIEAMKVWGIPSYRGSYAANLRLLLPYFLDETVKRVLYLDSDTIVNSSISDFYEMPLNDKTVAMVLDSLGSSYKVKYLGLKKSDYYYNSGVVLYDLEKWREKEYSEKIIEHVKLGNSHYASPDQDLINVICKEDILRISPRYNFQPVHMVYSTRIYFNCYGQKGYYSAEEIETAKKNVVIYHSFRFVGEFPWNEGTRHPYKDMFNYYLKISPWRNYIGQPADISFFMKIERFLYMILPKSIFLKIFIISHNIYLNNRPEIKKEKVQRIEKE